MIAFLITLLRFIQTVVRSLKDPDFQALVFLVVITLLSGTFFYHQVEGWSFLDSFYFSSITLTTVGYGDLSPSTPISKVFTVMYLFVGIGIILGFIDAVSKRALGARSDSSRSREDDGGSADGKPSNAERDKRGTGEDI